MVGDGHGFFDHGAEGPENDVGPVKEGFGFTDGEGGGVGFYGDAFGGASWVANEGGALIAEACENHVDKFVFVFGLHEEGARNRSEVGDVEEAVVGGAVVG